MSESFEVISPELIRHFAGERDRHLRLAMRLEEALIALCKVDDHLKPSISHDLILEAESIFRLETLR